MKYRWDKKYLHWGITAFLVLAGAIVFYITLAIVPAALFFFRHKLLSALMPIIYGFAIAYLLNPIVKFFENKVFFKLLKKKSIPITEKKKKIVRNSSIFLAIILTLLLLYGLMYMLIPQLITSISTMIKNAPDYWDATQVEMKKLFEMNPDLQKSFLKVFDYVVNYMTTEVLPELNNMLRQLSGGVLDFIMVLKNIFIGFIVSIYILGSKERFAAQGKKLLYAIFHRRTANLFISNLRFTDRKFGGFITGKIIDSFIIGVICFVFTAIMKIPYAVLVSVIVGVTNIIPFFGPYIGAIPCAMLILLVNPVSCIYFIIFIILLQTFDGNILGPKILSESTNLSSFWVIFSILIAGGLFGVLGMFVGVPIFAVIYALVNSLINRSLGKKKLSTETDSYLNLNFVKSMNNKETGEKEFVYFNKEQTDNEDSLQQEKKPQDKEKRFVWKNPFKKEK